jgi:PIN domain nuclease of toxin-antitoxin system
VAGGREVILDTCALLWLAGGGGKLSKAAARRIESAPVVCVCAISGFEVGIKCRKGKLELPARPSEWFATVLEHHGLTVLPLGLDICIRATELPAIHKDPCDRLIIAAAELHKMPVVTTDPRFKQHGIEVIS